jgi:4-hydroxy-tetrahydrodipicolinate synthase
MTAETTLRMAREIPNIIGVKEASGNMEQILTLLRDRSEGFLVLSGDDAWTLPLLAVGAEGLVSVASNEVPRLMRQMIDRRDVAIHNRLLPLLLGNFIESNPGPAKAALKMMGVLDSDTVRPPLAPMTEGNREKLRGILEMCGLLGESSNADH